jgi:DNA-binding transcriptional ArsR family regulator
MSILIKEKNNQYYQKKIETTENPKKLNGLLNETRWKILKLIAERPRYPADIAKELNLHQQKIYYHINKLKKSNIIEIKTKKEINGGFAKYYTTKSYAFALELPFGEEHISDYSPKNQSKKIISFLYPFIKGGILNSLFVVGSPDPHGPHQVRARDGHYAIETALFIGQYAKTPTYFSTSLDIDIKSENKSNKNLIIIGGPLTNIITYDINPYLPVKFNLEQYPFRGLISKKTNKIYSEDNIGFIAKIINPNNTNNSILILAGNRFNGTKASVLALTRHTEEILTKYNNEDNWATIIEGLDMDGDGKIDTIKILE